ncbi:hypothetical protein FHE66_14510 [Georgenia sp. 311]|uniref:hypothetical protein n=1 Tax=Georgenia sp. 311 TaxID=2585134 RepID=UPI0011129CDE|nr:hypothetical protein [Georgenia sp. 311]TNC16589.1 hypothetical protein FHE66_14510 [Georgenia sp. 311]
MRRKHVLFLSSLALATIGLTGCGDDSADGEATEPTTAAEEATTPEQPTTPEPEETTPAEENSAGSETDSAAGADLGASDPGPAAEGAVIPAEALATPPEAIGPYTLGEATGPARMYNDESFTVMIAVDSNVLSSPYESLVEYIETDNTAAGTGSCGTNESGSSITCYQRTADGVITVTATPEQMSLEDMVVFVNHYADQAGAA